MPLKGSHARLYAHAMSSADRRRFRVLIAGGGVAALEAALALRALAGELVATMLVAPEREFVYRPMRVLEPFAYPAARRYPLAELVSDIGAEFREDAVARVDSCHPIRLHRGRQ